MDHVTICRIYSELDQKLDPRVILYRQNIKEMIFLVIHRGSFLMFRHFHNYHLKIITYLRILGYL